MMLAVSQHAYLHNRVSGFAESLIDDRRFVALLTPGAEASVLRDARLPENLHEECEPAELEQRLITILMQEAVLLIRPLTGQQRDLMRYWMGRFDLINLKILLRGIAVGEGREILATKLLNLSPHNLLPLGEMLHSEDISEALRHLEQSPFAEMARHGRQIYSEKQSMFELESALDHHYFIGLLKRVNGQKGDDRLTLRSIIGRHLDQINLVWLLRFRLIYRLTAPHAYFLLVPSGHYLHRKQLLELAQLDSLDAIIAALPEGLNELLQGADTISEIEARMERDSIRTANLILRNTSFNITRALVYLLLRQRQMMRIHVLIKGRCLQLPESLILASANLTPRAE